MAVKTPYHVADDAACATDSNNFYNAASATSGAAPTRVKRVPNVVSFVGALATNAIVGKDIGTISRKYGNSIVPDCWAFGIWGIICTLLLGFCAWRTWCSWTRRSPSTAAGPPSPAW